MEQEGLPASIAVIFGCVILGALLVGAFILAAVLMAPTA